MSEAEAPADRRLFALRCEPRPGASWARIEGCLRAKSAGNRSRPPPALRATSPNTRFARGGGNKGLVSPPAGGSTPKGGGGFLRFSPHSRTRSDQAAGKKSRECRRFPKWLQVAEGLSNHDQIVVQGECEIGCWVGVGDTVPGDGQQGRLMVSSES